MGKSALTMLIAVAAILVPFGCLEDWGTLPYPNKGKYKVTFAGEADSCAETHYSMNIDNYSVGAYDNLLPVILNVDSGTHRFFLACSSAYRDGTFIARLHERILITGDTTISIDCDSCHPDY